MTARQELLEKMQTLKWVHCIDVGEGVTTPGSWPKEGHAPYLQVFDDLDFKGKKVLDIGCLDGLWSFEAEARGASEVYATDLVTQTHPPRDDCFRTAHALRDSNAVYVPDISVYDIERLGIRDFEIVLFMGVYYHLKDPLRALSRLRRVMKEGGIIVVEGQVTDAPGVQAEFFYRRFFGNDASNWWIPSIQCLREWVECTFFEIVKDYAQPLVKANFGRSSGVRKTGRHMLTGRAMVRADRYLGLPDEELGEYDLNVYGV
jgi:tRNA (mo5U34)-methyltransferase